MKRIIRLTENDLHRIVKYCVREIRETYNRHLINEMFGDVDTSGYICVGEIPYYPWVDNDSKNKVYVMVNPKKEMLYGREVNDVRYTENPDGSGNQTDSIPSIYKERIKIYPEHEDDEFGEMFLGKRKPKEEVESKHNEFMSNMVIIDDNLLLHHDSSYKITDGYIKKGITNTYSNNSDIGRYFWGSKDSGSDPSNSGTYKYYCLIPQSDFYDFETNAERLSLPIAMKKYGYCGQYWNDGKSIVVTTYKDTPIWCILDKRKGIWYDNDWVQIEKPHFFNI